MRILWSSDHHTVHQTTPTLHILRNLTRFLIEDNDLSKTDMVIFGGDFTERLVDAPNRDWLLVTKWVKNLLKKAYKLNKDLIVVWLAGTQSHDWGQPEHFLELGPEGLDVRYIDKLCIETYKEHEDFSIMYVPDNMGELSPEMVWELALKTLADNNLSEVDLVAAHLGFTFQLHPSARHSAHELKLWETIAKFYILAGHIHKPVSQGKLRTSGSFDRTAHGEEHPKGGYIVNICKETNVHSATFYENKFALPYLTISFEDDATTEYIYDETVKFINERKLVKNSQIRILGGKAVVTRPIMETLCKLFPDLGFKIESSKEKDQIVDSSVYKKETYKGVTVTKSNIKQSIKPELESNLKGVNYTVDSLFKVLEGFL